MYFLMEGDANPGTGYIRILAGGDELCYIPFSYDGKYISWGREFRQKSATQQATPPASVSSSGRPFYGSMKLRLQITTVPGDCEILYGREQDNFILRYWGSQAPATIHAHDNNEEFKFVIRRQGYQDFEWSGPIGALGVDEDGSLTRVEFNIKDQTWSHK
jgi:hypothetical protein